jgi:hypothetical protein
VHTLNVIAAGLILLGFFLLAGRFVGGSRAGMATAAKYFIPVWLAIAAVNMWSGVSRAGYSILDEIPILLLVFVIPAAPALLVAWRYRAHESGR